VAHAKKTTLQLKTLIYSDKDRVIQTMTKKNEKDHGFAFLIISANAHLAHLQSRESRHINTSLEKEPIFGNGYTFANFTHKKI